MGTLVSSQPGISFLPSTLSTPKPTKTKQNLTSKYERLSEKCLLRGAPWFLTVMRSACSTGDQIQSLVERSLQKENSNPFSIFCLGNPMHRG